MKRLLTFLQMVCGKAIFSFAQHRLSTEFSCADQLIRPQKDHTSDDPRAGSGVPVVGVF